MTEDRKVSHFLRQACHDLRAPLRSIRTSADLLLEDKESHEGVDQEQLLSQIVQGTQKMDVLIAAISSYSVALEIDPSKFQLSPLNVLLRTALARLAGDITTQRAVVTASNLPRVVGNQDRLTELLALLIANGLRGGTGAPCVDISCAKEGDAWLFRFRDNREGVEAEDLDRIFEPFSRVTKDPVGEGLGLAVCREIVKRHGGRIWAESPETAGMTVFFTLPAD